MTTSTHLLQGAASIYVAPAGTALDAGDDPADDDAWVSIGQTSKALTVKDTPSVIEARSQQSARALGKAVSENHTELDTAAREFTAAKLAQWLRGEATTTAGSTTIEPGGLGPITEWSIAVVGPWPGGKAIVYAPRVCHTNGASFAFDNANYGETDITWEVLESDLPGGWVMYLPADEDPDA